MPAWFSLRYWHQGDKSRLWDQTYTLPYPPTPVSPFHGEPTQFDDSVLAFDAVAPWIRAEDVEPLAALADELEGALNDFVVGVAFDVEEEQVGRIAIGTSVGGGE